MDFQEITKSDKKWRRIAYKICKNKSFADDLVQDMYLNIIDYPKPMSEYFVITCIKNLFLNHVTKKKTIQTVTYHPNIESPLETLKYEIDDEERKILEKFRKLEWHKREFLKEKAEGESLRAIQKKYNINYGFIYRETKEAINTIIK